MGPIFGVTVGGAGGGPAVGYGAYASRPGSPAIGDQYICSDGPHKLICTVAGQWTITIPGTVGSWQALDAANFSAGYGTPTFSQLGAGVSTRTTSPVSAIKKDANSANFRIELVSAQWALTTADLVEMIVLADASVPRKALRAYGFANSFTVNIQRDSSWGVTFHSTAYTQPFNTHSPYSVVAAEYDGANITFQYSPDLGANWITIHTEAVGTSGFTCIPTCWGLAGNTYALGYREVAL